MSNIEKMTKKKTTHKSRGKRREGVPKTTIERFKSALKDSNGIITVISERLGVTDSATYYFIDRHPELKILIAQESAKVLAKAESVVHNALSNPDPKISVKTAQWLLERKKKDEYSTRTESVHAGAVSIKGYTNVSPDMFPEKKSGGKNGKS